MNENITISQNIINLNEDLGAAFLRTILEAKNNVPISHKRTADNYVIIKRMYKFHTVKATVSLSEYDLLKNYNLKPLECSSAQEMNDEIARLKEWSVSENPQLRKDADNIIVIRAKELKNITASAYSTISKEMFNGYRVLEKYFEEITKFYR